MPRSTFGPPVWLWAFYVAAPNLAWWYFLYRLTGPVISSLTAVAVTFLGVVLFWLSAARTTITDRVALPMMLGVTSASALTALALIQIPSLPAELSPVPNWVLAALGVASLYACAWMFSDRSALGWRTPVWGDWQITRRDGGRLVAEPRDST